MRRLACGVLLSAATAAFAWQAEPEASFTTTTKLIQISVVAQNKLGKPVTDLKREDFRVFDNGVPQELRLFIAESPGNAPTPRSRGPNTFTNEITAGARGGYSVILFDNLVSGFGDLQEEGSGFGVQKVLRILQTIPAQDKVAIYAFGRKLQVIREFTSDRDSLEQLLRTWKPSVDDAKIGTALCGGGGEVPPNVVALAPEVAAGIERAAISCGGIDLQQRAKAMETELAQIADHLAGIPGRKNLIWLANRFPVSAGPSILKLSSAGVSVYPVDENGVCRLCPPPQKDQMRAIAAQTGGVAYIERNDLDAIVREALDDGRVSYTLGFYQPGEEKRAMVHRLGVVVDRPGVTLRYRAVYVSEPPPGRRGSPVAEFVQAINRPVDATSIAIRIATARTAGKLDLVVTLDPAELDLAESNGLWKGKLELVARFTAADGTVAGDVVSQTMTLNLRPPTYENAVRNGLEYHNALKLPAKAVELKLLVGNLASGKIGTLSVPLADVKCSGPIDSCEPSTASPRKRR